MDCCYLYILWCYITYNNDDEGLNDWGRDLVTFINVWFCVDVVFNLDLHEVARMTEKLSFAYLIPAYTSPFLKNFKISPVLLLTTIQKPNDELMEGEYNHGIGGYAKEDLE